MLPPIRYPLPTLVALALAALLARQGVVWTREWRAEMASKVQRALEGPPVPSSPRPKVVAGPIVRRALLLRDGVPVASRPKGPTVETLDRRMFLDVYDTWPDSGPTTHLRVGNRKAIGWVEAVDVLPWDTRLVVKPPEGRLSVADSPGGPSTEVEVGATALPVLSWKADAVEVAIWEPSKPWASVARRGWVKLSDLPSPSWGIWIGQVELPILLGLANRGETPRLVRLRAVLGRLADNRNWTQADLDAARPALPAVVFEGEPDPRKAAEALAEANARPTGDASWSGLTFRALPLADLP